MTLIQTDMKYLDAQHRFTVAQDPAYYLAFTSAASTGQTVVCVYLQSDQHLRTTSDIMIARSIDGGLTWSKPISLDHKDIYQDGQVWLSPTIASLRDGRLVVLCDLANRKSDQEHVSLYEWQKPHRGMANYLFWSDDQGCTWQGPQWVDAIGGEPMSIVELENGDQIFTRTESADQPDHDKDCRSVDGSLPPSGYYRNVVVASIDRGKSWHHRGVLSDDPLYSDAEVGIVEVEPGKLLAITRCGDQGSFWGQPSRLILGHDSGRQWGKPQLLPIYAHRPVVRKLQSGKLLVTYRNAFGTTGTYALIFDADEPLPYEPTSFIWEPDACTLENGVMNLVTHEGTAQAATFALYPLENEQAHVDATFEMRLDHADTHGCCFSVGCWIQFQPGRLCLADRPDICICVDTTIWHTYRLTRKAGHLQIFVDGECCWEGDISSLHTRYLHFGNRILQLGAASYAHNAASSDWRKIDVLLKNPKDHSFHWQWDASRGLFPDQFRRDRIVCLERSSSFHHGDNGYSGWTQLPDGDIVIIDYTKGFESAEKPFIRSYVVQESDL